MAKLSPEQIEILRAKYDIKPQAQTSGRVLSEQELAQMRAKYGIPTPVVNYEATGRLQTPSMQVEEAPKVFGNVSEKGYFKPTEKVRVRDVAREAVNAVGEFGNMLASSERNLAQTIGDALYANKAQKNIAKIATGEQEMADKLVEKMKQNIKDGKDNARLLKAYQQLTNGQLPQLGDIVSSANKKTLQIAGEALGVGLDVATLGTYSKAAKSAQLLPKAKPSVVRAGVDLVKKPSGLFTKEGAKAVAGGAGLGYGFDVSLGLQGERGEDREGMKAAIPGLGTAIGAGLPLAAGLSKSIKNVTTADGRLSNIISKRYKELEKLDNYQTIKKATEKGRARNIDIKKALSESDVLAGAVDKTGTITTKGEGAAIEQYTKQYIDGNEDLVSRVLQKEGKAISPALIKKKLIEAVENAGIEGENLVRAKQKINREMAGYALRANRVGAVPVETLHKAKIDKYNSINFFTEGSTKIYDKTIAKALKELVESSTDSADIRAVNKELSKHFAVIDYLSKLDNKKVQGGRLGKYFGQTIGAIVGSHYGPVGSVIGAEMGGRLKGANMARVFRGGGRTAEQAPVITGVENMLSKEPLRLPQSSIKSGSLNTSQASTTAPVKNAIIPNDIPQTTKPVNPLSKTDSAGAFAGFEQDEDGNIKFNPQKAALGVVGLSAVKKVQPKINLPKAYKETGNLTTKILKDLEGKTTVSKQYILDATNRGELKQVERDLVRQIANTMPEGQINVSDFAKKVKAELLPLKRMSIGKQAEKADMGDGVRVKYENISLPDELRGSVKNYDENIYRSPIKTSAGRTHFSDVDTGDYFGHTRIEDMADNKTRRVIEVQSDLYQKGNLEREVALPNRIKRPQIEKEIADLEERIASEGGKFSRESDIKSLNEWKKTLAELNAGRGAEVSKLQQYNDPTAHFRMVREEIKKASQDGKTKLQFPTGETAMKIEGLNRNDMWYPVTEYKGETQLSVTPLKQGDLKVGSNVATRGYGSDTWIITDVLGDGKFKAVPKDKVSSVDYAQLTKQEQAILKQAKLLERKQLPDGRYYAPEQAESFDISSKVDTNNPIYKFYEKDLGKYLKKFGAELVTDSNGVQWYEVPIKKEYGKMPVEAFGLVPILGFPKQKEE